MSPAEKRVVWRRITQEGTAWRFNRYAERARGDAGLPAAATKPDAGTNTNGRASTASGPGP